MRYLGGISGQGTLKCNGEEVGRASYDFDGYYKAPMGITSSGEIRLSPAALRGVFGRNGIQLLTDDGRLFDLKFSEKELRSATDVAHVDIIGGLPTSPQNWRH